MNYLEFVHTSDELGAAKYRSPDKCRLDSGHQWSVVWPLDELGGAGMCDPGWRNSGVTDRQILFGIRGQGRVGWGKL